MTATAIDQTAADATDRTDDRTGDRATLGGDIQSRTEQVALALFIVVPFLAVVAAVPVAWGGWLGWSDVVIAVVMYAVTGHGVTVGFHRLLHAQVVQAQPAGQDRPGDRRLDGDPGPGRPLGGRPPQAPQVLRPRRRPALARGATATTSPALTKGLFYAHMGWLFDTEQTSQRKYAPDLLKDRDIVRISRQFPLCVVVSLLPPGGRRRAGSTWSWQGARDRVLLGLAGAGRRCCTTSPGRSTRSATPSASGRSSLARQVRQRLVAGDPLDGRVLAQPAPRATRPAPGTACCAARSTPRRGSSGLLEKARLGHATSAGRSRSASTPSGSPPRARPALPPDGVVDVTRRRRTPSRRRPRPDDRRRATRAADRDRPRRCSPSAASTAPRSRRSPPAPRSPSRSSTSTSAARRASTPSSSTARCASCSAMMRVVADRRRRRASCSSRRRARCSTTSSSPPTASGSWCATRPIGSDVRLVRLDHRRHRRRGWSTSWRRSSAARGFDAEVRADVRPDARRHGRHDRPVVARRPQAGQGRGRRAPGQPRLERPVRHGEGPGPAVPRLTPGRRRQRPLGRTVGDRMNRPERQVWVGSAELCVRRVGPPR